MTRIETILVFLNSFQQLVEKYEFNSIFDLQIQDIDPPENESSDIMNINIVEEENKHQRKKSNITMNLLRRASTAILFTLLASLFVLQTVAAADVEVITDPERGNIRIIVHQTRRTGSCVSEYAGLKGYTFGAQLNSSMHPPPQHTWMFFARLMETS
ncbi:hypothetical protein GRS66_009174 [Saccharomyces pastorianus]|uniref:Uncharacterized protein n=1 Tax=Saccharomyces pastorianus TaxID=27292 RepID=A0A6C1ECA3_SACPS|nr:hypothetical protein GRS66_009174 [Saccharomyces pastorianus]